MKLTKHEADLVMILSQKHDIIAFGGSSAFPSRNLWLACHSLLDRGILDTVFKGSRQCVQISESQLMPLCYYNSYCGAIIPVESFCSKYSSPRLVISIDGDNNTFTEVYLHFTASMYPLWRTIIPGCNGVTQTHKFSDIPCFTEQLTEAISLAWFDNGSSIREAAVNFGVMLTRN